MHDQLNKAIILSLLDRDVKLDYIEIYETITSTNDALYEHLKKNSEKHVVFLSEEQTAGKGRVGKSWHSPKYQNIYLSLSWQFELPVHQLQDLSIHVGKALIKMLQSFGIDEKIKLKYPNDILYDNKKLAGILVETFSQTPHTTITIIGVGFNVHLKADDEQLIRQPWTSLDLITQQDNDRNQICALIINALHQLLRGIH